MDSLILSSALQGASSSLIYGSCGIMILKGYKSHGYLYKLDFSKEHFAHWINLFIPLARVVMVPKLKAFLTDLLPKAGYHRSWTPERVVATQLCGAAALFVTTALFISLLPGVSYFWAFMAACLPLILPLIKIKEQAASRLLSCRRDLSYFLDYIALAISAGMEFSKALKEVIASAPPSPLRDEFEVVSIDLDLGKQKAEVLQEMQDRLDSTEIRIFVQNMIQALRLGTNISVTLMAISENLNQKRFQRAEEEAGKISVRMMLPLLVFVLPVVLILIIGPMMLGFVNL